MLTKLTRVSAQITPPLLSLTLQTARYYLWLAQKIILKNLIRTDATRSRGADASLIQTTMWQPKASANRAHPSNPSFMQRLLKKDTPQTRFCGTLQQSLTKPATQMPAEIWEKTACLATTLKTTTGKTEEPLP